ncbi:uncharacterized protein LOC132163584 [Corylus avellana]|uniref:uncharacterized protein LOC132163584 n=1 Tax=Corylus avellana TaxID=13451 RepID=UPI00286C029D|nr:uncharacterized protein LOC132163584 [Corylus avellana]XP_059429908.1 uncharacterized protein LOC132163584 [Corylus avellana]
MPCSLQIKQQIETKMATSIPNSSKAISLKLLVDSNSRKVLFAEAGKEFVDFLFGLIYIPIGSIMGVLWSHDIDGPGSLSRVYESIQNLDSTCLHQTKEEFLMPEPAFPSDTHPPSLLLNFVPPKHDTTTSVENQLPFETLFGSGRSDRTSLHPDMFPWSRSIENTLVVEQHKETGYVKGVVTFMVKDDLTVTPMSTISSITLLNTFNVKDVSLLREKMVTVDIETGLELVKASFGSTTVLTDVFLRND